MRTHVVHARADIVATKIYFSFFFSSMHILFSQKGFTYDFGFLLAFLNNKKIRFRPKKWGEPPFTPQIVSFGQTAGILPEGIRLRF